MHFMLGWFAHPIFVNGDYPNEVKERVAAKSSAQGLGKSRLPEFTKQEKLFIRGQWMKPYVLSHQQELGANIPDS